MKKKGLITTCLCAALGVGLTATLAACNNGGGTPEPTKFTVTTNCATGCKVEGLAASYAKNDLVSFSVVVTDTTKKVDEVTSPDVVITKSVSKNYEFSMPEKNVTVNVTLRDAGTLGVTFNPETVEVGDVTTFTCTLDGQALPTGSEVEVTPTEGQYAEVVAGTNTIKGLAEGTQAFTFSVKGKTYTPITANLTVTKSGKVTFDGLMRDAVTTPAKKNKGYAGKTYTTKTRLVAYGDADAKGYANIILKGQDDSYFVASAGTNQLKSVVEIFKTENKGAIVKGDVTNYYGLLEYSYNSTTKSEYSFTADSTIIYDEPKFADLKYEDSEAEADFIRYYNWGAAASAASQTDDGNTYDNLASVLPVRVNAIAKGNDLMSFKDAPSADAKNLNIGASQTLTKAVLNASVGDEFVCEGFLLSSNPSNKYSKFLITSYKPAIAGKVIILNTEKTLETKATLQMNAVVVGKPTEKVTWSLTSAPEGTTIDKDGLLTAGETTGEAVVKASTTEQYCERTISIIEPGVLATTVDFRGSSEAPIAGYTRDVSSKTKSEHYQKVEQNNAVFVNTTAKSTTDVMDCSTTGHIRCYANSDISLTYTEDILKIVVHYTASDRVITGTYPGYTITTSGTESVIKADSPSTTYTLSTLKTQGRILTIDIYTKVK